MKKKLSQTLSVFVISMLLSVFQITCLANEVIPPSASTEEFQRKMMKVNLGMKKADVVKAVGEPSSIVSRSRNDKGEITEIYSHDDDTPIFQRRMNSPSFLITYVNDVVESIQQASK